MEMVTITKEEHGRLLAAAEDLEDIRTLNEARANPEEGMPHEFLVKLLEGEHPVAVFRSWRGLSQAELARRSRVNRVQIIDMEKGRAGCSVETLRKLADALDVSMDELSDGWTD